MPQGARERGRRGFTLTEILVVLVLSAIVLFGVYNLFEKSSSTFRVQDQIASLLGNLRFASEHLKMDLGRTGFLASSNSQAQALAAGGPVCFSSAAMPLQGLTIRRDGEEDPIATTVHNAAVNPNVLPTSLTLFGDFWSQGPFSVHRVSGDLIELDGSAYNGGLMPDVSVMQEWFRAGRLVRVQNRDGLEMYYYASDFADTGGGPAGTWPVLRVDQAIPVVYGGGCGVEGQGTGAMVNPVGYLRYRISQDTRQGAPLDKYDLVREELSPDDGSIVAQSQLTIAEYAVDLQFYDFVFVTAPPPTAPALNIQPNVTTVSTLGGGGALGGGALASPELLRALTFKISLRTREEDPNETHRPRQNRWQRMSTFDVNTAVGGAARVRSVAGRTMLDNFAL